MKQESLALGLVDSHGRRIHYIRLSLTDRCNFRCVYCMPCHGTAFIPHEEILSFEELLRFCRLTAALGVTHYKITGGEALCRRGSLDFIEKLTQIAGIEQVTLTTNGTLLPQSLQSLAAAGIRSINVSLDALSQQVFSRITRSSVPIEDILFVLEQAKQMGMQIKINTVPIQDYNESELVPLANYALVRGFPLRFIELMPVGEGKQFLGIPLERINKLMEQTFGKLRPYHVRLGNGPARYFQVQGYATPIGYIAALSDTFCKNCNRVRLTSWGFLKTCLHHDIGTNMKRLLRTSASDAEILSTIIQTVNKKPFAHTFCRPVQEVSLDLAMNSVGG